MSNRLVLQDLVDLLSKKSKITKKEADSFFRELFQLILDRIFENDSVKIKDFGTFKLVLVSSRESVDVNTGEKIEIRAHSKFSFIPDKALKNLVNKPFSQFETILLEDEVDFDAPLESNEDLDYEIEEKEYIMDIPQDAENEGVSEPKHKNAELVDAKSDDSVQSDTNSKDIADDVVVPADKVDRSVSSAIQYPSYNRSFVYTYTTTSSTTSDSITITLPKNNLSGISSLETVEEISSEVPVEKMSETELENGAVESKVSDSEIENSVKNIQAEESADTPEESVLTEQPVLLDDVSLSPISVEGKEEVFGDEIEVKEKRYIEPIVPATNDEVMYIDSDSEIETEEDVVLPPPVTSYTQRIAKSEDTESVESEQNTPKHKLVYSVEDPERPLFPDEDEGSLLTDDDFVEIRSDDSGFEDKNETKIINHTGSNKPTSIRSVSYTETIDDVEIPYHDYYAPTLGQKLKKALPWVVLGLVVLGFVGYNVIPMFNIQYDYENKLKRVNLTTSDTLPLMNQVDSEDLIQTAVLIDSMKVQPANANSDSLQSKSKVLVKANDSTEISHVPDRKISENLKIDIINKAQMYVQHYSAKPEDKAGLKPEIEDKKENQKLAAKVQYDTIKRGVTLRNLATKHYGEADYWVYIYEANKAKIRNPNSVPIGTSLVMPALSTYGVSNPKDRKELQKAQNMAVKILR